ncbi:hypothetical protein [Paractinoplanes lichenicola]|uniref:Uncharacterized protein n=1 Tax=Paractinoplanes lichenicola TaxID=2802976 RepID=A0ABS1VNB9_9ACTN|nr:hypothetical protein [Actinoplanes lichenicola]MBL7256222.1 hypothetical protein [Actinoplanes lichenicola]
MSRWISESWRPRSRIDSRTGALGPWTSDGGIDGESPVDLDDLDPALILVDPVPSHAARHTVDWLMDSGLVDEEQAVAFGSGHPDPAVP